MTIRDDIGVLLVVLCEWPCGADRAFMIRLRNITLQESGICNIHLVESSASALLNGLTGTLRQPRLSQKKGLVHPANGWERHHPHNR